jgi:YD repeat-containing protein
MKTYKATRGGRCRSLTYEVGKTYTHSHKPVLCQYGFHSCPDLIDVFDYYEYEEDLIIFEVENLGDYLAHDSKIVCDKIKILREVPKEEWHNCKFDSDGNLIHFTDCRGKEKWTDYDIHGNKIYVKNSNGLETYYKYDEQGNRIHTKNSRGYEAWREYDEQGNLIHRKVNNDYEVWRDYDEAGNLIRFRDSDGYEINQKYDSSGNMICFEDAFINNEYRDYDERGNMIHCRKSNFLTGDSVFSHNSSDVEYWKEYDGNNKPIAFKDHTGHEIISKYDENGNLIYFKNNKGIEWEITIE